MKRRTIGVGLAVLVGAAGSAGWVGARSIKSPEEVAAQQGPPPASRITVPVVRKELASTLIARGTVRFGEPKEVLLPSSALKAGTSQVVTAPAAKGTEVAEGEKLMEIGGRPVLALQGDTPMYRDLRPGDTGADVEQLERALARLGFDPGPSEGTYDSRTAKAVEAWFRSVGFDAFGPTDAQRTALANARDAATKAAESLRQSRQSLADARKPISADKLLQAQEQIAVAKAKLQSAEEEAAKQTAAAQSAVDAKTVALQVAQSNRIDLVAALDKARADASDPSPVDDGKAALQKAEGALAQAQRGVPKAQASVVEAETAVEDAKLAAADAQLAENEANDAIARAQQALDLANATPAKTSLGPNGLVMADTDSRNAMVSSAQASLRQANSALRAAQSSTRQALRTVETRIRAVDDARNGVAVADLAVLDAQAALARAQRDVAKADQTMSERRRAITAAETKLAQADQAARQAQTDLDQAVAGVPVTARQVGENRRMAQSQLRIAEASARTASTAADTSAMAAQVTAGEQAKRRADADLAELEGEIGIVVPANEAVFFPSLPLRVDSTKLARGDVASGAVMTVTTSRLAVDSSLDLADAQLAQLGDKVQIDSTDFGISLAGRISELATTPGTDGVDATKVYMEITPDDTPDLTGLIGGEDGADDGATEGGPERSPVGVVRRPGLESLNGQSVKITVPVRSTGGPVLAVPTPAVSVAVDGSNRVEIEDAPGAPTRFVTVKVGLAAEGLVAVAPIEGELDEGMQVVVGSRATTDIEGVVEPNDEGGDEDPGTTDTGPTDSTAAA